jgi:hypothetical protein
MPRNLRKTSRITTLGSIDSSSLPFSGESRNFEIVSKWVPVKLRLFAMLLAGVFSAALLGQSPPPDPGPVQAELLGNLDARRLANGKAVFARVTQTWNGPDCTLRQGAVLEATVEESIPHSSKNESKLALSFKRAQCSGREMQPMDLVLTVVARPPTVAPVLSGQYAMTMDLPPPHPIGPVGGEQSRGGGAISPQAVSASNFTLSALALNQTGSSIIDHRFPVRENIRPGDVFDIKGLHLDIGTGPNRSTVLWAKSRDVYLSEFTQILLVPPARAFRIVDPTSASGLPQPHAGGTSLQPQPAAALAAVPAVPPINDIAICAPPGCAVDLPVSPEEVRNQSASSIATRPLGYTPRSKQVLASIPDEETLGWLGPGQLLFTFNPHKLVHRSSTDHSGTTRLIRAILLDTATRKAVRAVDWQVVDSHRYLWQLDGNRILVHVGNELRVYRADMEVERTIPLTGPLMFIRIAPNGSLLAVGTLQERHSPDLHAKLREELAAEPEEDVNVAILDEEFKTVAQMSTVSNLMAPTLLDEGQVRLQSEHGQWYRLAVSTWDNKRSALARFHSFCTPEVTSTAPDLLFLLTCSAPNGRVEYSVLRNDGRVLLRGSSGPQELGHEALGSRRSKTFAVKIVHAERPMLPDTNFTGSELDSEEVRVYRAEDGKRLLAVIVKQPTASHGGYALSPDGTQLAVLSGSEIQFFPVPAE